MYQFSAMSFLTILLLLCSGCKNENKYETRHSPKESHADAYIYKTYFHNCQFKKNIVCELPFSSIYSDVINDRKTLFGIKGYLVKKDEMYSLYPSQESVVLDSKSDAISIIFASGLDNASIDLYSGNYVFIVGKFIDHSPQPYWSSISVSSEPVLLGNADGNR